MRIIRFVIPAYKKPEQLLKCKQAIMDLVLPEEVLTDITVIDNNETNLGFTKAVNIGVREAIENGDEYAIVLNQDCYLDKNALVEMLSFMDSHPHCAIGGIRQMSSDNPDLVIHAGCTQAYPNGIHISGLLSEGTGKEDKLTYWVNGACMIVRCKAAIDFGLMDESMFLIGSDSDWCFTARARGHEVWYIANAFCVHEQGISSTGGDEAIQKIMYKDMLAWRNKWIGTDLFRELTLEIFD